MDAELARLIAAGRDDAALVRTGADDQRFPAPFGMVQELDGREEGVHVDVEEGAQVEELKG